jgi:hypothetical protein
MQPGAMPQLQFLDLRILLHLPKNVLIEELPWTPHQLFLRLKVSTAEEDSDGFKTVTYRK